MMLIVDKKSTVIILFYFILFHKSILLINIYNLSKFYKFKKLN